MLFSRATVIFLLLAVFLSVAMGQSLVSYHINVDGEFADFSPVPCSSPLCPIVRPIPPFNFTFRVTGVGSHLAAMRWDHDIGELADDECTVVHNSASRASGESFKAQIGRIPDSELTSLDNSNAATCGDVEVALSRTFELQQENQFATVIFRVSLEQPASGFYIEQSDTVNSTTIFYSSVLDVDVVTPAPTQAPTRIPTNFPSQAPTRFPTNTPSQVPTRVPTNTPSQAPTSTPTPAPSLNPSKSPTLMPTPQLVAIAVKKPKKGKGKGCLKIKARGKVSVYIVGSNTFDVSKIDLQTLRLNGLTVAVRRNGTRMCVIPKSGAGMTCEFEMNVNKWTPITSYNGLVEVRLSGQLKSGIEFVGYDTVCLAKR